MPRQERANAIDMARYYTATAPKESKGNHLGTLNTPAGQRDLVNEAVEQKVTTLKALEVRENFRVGPTVRAKTRVKGKEVLASGSPVSIVDVLQITDLRDRVEKSGRHRQRSTPTEMKVKSYGGAELALVAEADLEFCSRRQEVTYANSGTQGRTGEFATGNKCAFCPGAPRIPQASEGARETRWTNRTGS